MSDQPEDERQQRTWEPDDVAKVKRRASVIQVANGWDTGEQRRIQLRNEHDGADSRYLWAYVDGDGNLHIDGQDLGPATGSVSSDGEYEWFKTIRAADIPNLVIALDGNLTENVLDILESRYTGDGSYELEKRIRDSGVAVEVHSQ